MSESGRRYSAPVSVLDRLLVGDTPVDKARMMPGGSLRRLRAALLRDLEALLNARKPWRSMPARLSFLRTSALSYGLADFAGGTVKDAMERTRLCAEIADAITRFEPRLTAVEVELAETPSSLEAVLSFRIKAVLLIDPVPEPVVFDTMLDTATSDIHLRVPEDG